MCVFISLTHTYVNVISNVTLLSSNTERFSCRHEEVPTKGCSVFRLCKQYRSEMRLDQYAHTREHKKKIST